eukprot:CAMPEP_0185695756 /NCGR_PEP_ID=MMETSP1164-20130828/4721_1 /TAXON_ID=1104430 /ORGANISM="Chrysoreinhardia sp, Strain CCMP2950" /LENGTH=237 /DNA_ID=CAMNT_0028362623 /DNA_START=241 /DNA_END=952 /DNA_ORIENTATION=+
MNLAGSNSPHLEPGERPRPPPDTSFAVAAPWSVRSSGVEPHVDLGRRRRGDHAGLHDDGALDDADLVHAHAAPAPRRARAPEEGERAGHLGVGREGAELDEAAELAREGAAGRGRDEGERADAEAELALALPTPAPQALVPGLEAARVLEAAAPVLHRDAEAVLEARRDAARPAAEPAAEVDVFGVDDLAESLRFGRRRRVLPRHDRLRRRHRAVVGVRASAAAVSGRQSALIIGAR